MLVSTGIKRSQITFDIYSQNFLEKVRGYRLRASLKKDEKCLAQKGRMLALAQGSSLKVNWWGKNRWGEIHKLYPFLFRLVSSIRASILTIEKEVNELT